MLVDSVFCRGVKARIYGLPDDKGESAVLRIVDDGGAALARFRETNVLEYKNGEFSCVGQLKDLSERQKAVILKQNFIMVRSGKKGDGGMEFMIIGTNDESVLPEGGLDALTSLIL